MTLLERQGSVTVTELMAELNASESTIRRDLNTLASRGNLVKVHGGAIARENAYATRDDEVALRKQLHMEEKLKIARYAASLVREGDFVYVDAGTTTELLAELAENREAVYVTNAVTHAKALAEKGCRVYLLGGEFKGTTEAIVGEEAVASIEKYNFTIGFFGTNGITRKQGFTTPEIKEAMVKKKAFEQTKKRYVLADGSKFGSISAVSFAPFDDAVILTAGRIPEDYQKKQNVKEVRG